jgi:hypothetical protein
VDKTPNFHGAMCGFFITQQQNNQPIVDLAERIPFNLTLEERKQKISYTLIIKQHIPVIIYLAKKVQFR